MSDKKEFALSMTTDEDVTNIGVGLRFNQVVGEMLRSNVKILVVKILPQENSLYIKPFMMLKEKVLDDFFEINAELSLEKGDGFDTIREKIAFTFSETVIDIWNKFGADEYLLRLDFPQSPNKIKILWNKGMSKQDIDAYWKRNDQFGYNPNAKFWKRQWLREEQKTMTTGGGKL